MNLEVNNPGSVTSVPDPDGKFLAPGSQGPLAGQPAENPLEALMEQIKALKEEMHQLLGNRSSSHGVIRFSEGPEKKNGFAPSNYQLYKMINPDPFVIMDGRKILGEDRYI